MPRGGELTITGRGEELASVGPHAAAGVDTSIPPEDRYEIVGRIASGGMAEIYLARLHGSSRRGNEVVLKRLMPELQNDQEFVQMFYDEANIASQLSHPNIVQIFELGELDGSLFIAMELLRGVNLRDLLARLHSRGQRVPIALALRVACCALDALDYAHRFTDESGRRLNVVHRDVSPQNIICCFDGAVKLVDFGVAKAEGRLHQTRAGLIKGKFAYMSPEQVSGGNVDGRSDLFALAEVFYELLLKRHPFYAESDMDVLRAILDKDPPHPSAIDPTFPAPLADILVRALKKDPDARYRSASEMHDAFERLLSQSRMPATAAMLGHFLSEAFADRVRKEQAARAQHDDDALIDAMTAGRADEAAFRAAQSDDFVPPVETERPRVSERLPAKASYDHISGYGSRDRVVEVARGPEVRDPAEDNSQGFMAHSGYRAPTGANRRFTSQVRGLFDQDDSTPFDLPTEDQELDEGELPTMLGTLSAQEMEQLRRRSEFLPPAYSGGVTVTPPGSDAVVVQQAIKASSMRPDHLAVSHRSIAPAGPPPWQSVTPRSKTVLDPDDPHYPAGPDRMGLLIFVAGVGALLGAIGYAVFLYLSAQNSVTELELRSQPSGAAIWLDGADTGAITPHSFRNVRTDRTHTVEFRRNGYRPCRRQIQPRRAVVEQVRCTLTPE